MKRYDIIITSLALLIGSAGCSVFKSSDKSGNSGNGLQGWVEEGKEDASKVKDAVRNESGRIKKGSGKVMAEAKESIGKISGSSESVEVTGDWAIETVLGKKAVGETAPYLKFVPSEKRIYGNNGCNVINGVYAIDGKDYTLSFSNLATTMMLCAQTNITDVEIGEALSLTRKYSVVSSDPDKTMTLYDEGENAIMTLMHRDFHFLDGTWSVVAIDGVKVNIPDMKIALDVDEKRMHGNTGCNIINGELETDMDTANSISISKIAMTKMACPDSGWETRMTMALEEAVTAKQINSEEIELIGSNGQKVMLLRRTSAIED